MLSAAQALPASRLQIASAGMGLPCAAGAYTIILPAISRLMATRDPFT